MKSLKNLTEYFFEQSQSFSKAKNPSIDIFSMKLLNKTNCQLCLKEFDLDKRIPRILIHCGHTFCTTCLKQFYMNKRVRCPGCLKVIKNISSVQNLPINHTIFISLKKQNNKNQSEVETEKDASIKLYKQFEVKHKENVLKNKDADVDLETHLPLCPDHLGRVEHFFCVTHQIGLCRECVEIGHKGDRNCKVVDLFQIKLK